LAKTLLVTGGSRGIGAAVSRLAATAGWRVAVNYAANAGQPRASPPKSSRKAAKLLP
jgi:NAD(P)-dependent dehydrogenase (short-subunit alcohol dehydrogenase family)